MNVCRSLISRFGAIVLAAVIAGPTLAATIEVEPSGDSVVIVVKGDLDLGDGEKFADAVSGYGKGIVVFASAGGNLLAGLQIGTIIRLRNFATVVPDDVGCASACAFAWLGGTRRFMGSRAHIGFHAAYVVVDGEPNESGVGNALVGAYLNRIGLSDRAIIYITQAHPTEMTWLTLQQAVQSGIEVAVLPPMDRETRGALLPAPPPAPARPDRGPALNPIASTFLDRYFAQWSEGNAQALAYFDETYATSVDFYGKAIGHEPLMEEKRKFERLYAPRSMSISIDCDQNSSTCTIKGIVDWDCRSPARHAKSVGTANFTLQIAVSKSGNVQIVAEAGSVISRQLTR